MEQYSSHSFISKMLFFLMILLQVICVISARSNETDKLSLLEFKAKIDRDPLGLLRSWNDSAHFCLWPGVTCSRRHLQRVTRLDVSDWQLEGQLSSHIGNLSFLRVLYLVNNSFNLEIPQEIGRLFRLEEFNIWSNKFSGTIPANISSCSSLSYLRMVNNNLSGRIPEKIGLLSKLQNLELGANSLVGEIPRSIGNLSSLVFLYLGFNHLNGTIPYTIAGMERLRELELGDNDLSGTIPLAVYNSSTIEYFAVSRNRLEGQIPYNLGYTLPNIQEFIFNENHFSGTLPGTISNASKLVVFQVAENNLTGNLPSLASLSNLVDLAASFNSLGYGKNGDLNFLRNIANCTGLERLTAGYNNFGGTIPETMGNVTSATRLRVIALGSNLISGNIPNGVGNLINLEVFALELNRLSGPIPSTIGKLRNMSILFLEGNQLSDMIPTALHNLTLLSKMFLSMNRFQGSIPESLGEIKNLQALSLAENNLSGQIPSQLMGLSSLTISLNLSHNQLSGSIPMDVGKLVSLGILDFSENNLSGEIPNTIGRCESMEYLYLQGNFLQGSIPKDLDSLKGVREIDLSRNSLSGQIPMYFEEFRGLLFLNLSFNDFEGQVPQHGVFQNASKFSISGNTRLCGGLPELKLRACPSKVFKKRAMSRKTKLSIIISCSITGFILLVSLVMLIFCSKKRNKSTLESSAGTSLPRISYGDLSNATDGFSSTNLIGVGCFASVYKGILNPENNLIAVKVLNLNVARSLKSFAVECDSLRVIKHRNLVKFVTVCSSIDFKGNDFRALVYELMENGNLDEWLHSQLMPQQQSKRLNLVQRVNVSIDVASALDYLHNHCPESIAHCDIKPSNILLDGEMVAHVGDFGLAKLLTSALSSSATNQTSSASLVRGTVGYVAPEYAMGGEVSTLGDIYSFGILLLEMFTGKRPTDNMFKDDFDLNAFATMALPEHITEIVDPVLLEDEEEGTCTENVIRGSNDENETMLKSLASIIEIGVGCSSKFPGERRNIGDVTAELRKIRDVLHALEIPQLRVAMRRT